MRIRIIRRPAATSIDGIQLSGFEPGSQYDVGTSLGTYLLADGSAVPVVDEPVLVVPLSETDGLDPPNPKRESFPRDPKEPSSVAADRDEARRKRAPPRRDG